MSRAIVPIADMARRVPEAGRIRTGKKNGKVPVAIGEFRFTSHDKAAIEQIAHMYGGEVKDWEDPKAAAGQFEVATDATEIRIVLPPSDPLGGTPTYELWGGKGCERRCDGVTCTTVQIGPEGPEPADVACMCVAKGVMACKPTTHLSVILPEVRFAGVWRLTTHSWNAAQELPGMVDLIRQAQGVGLQYATLGLKHRKSNTGGQTRNFIVPVLGTAASIEQLAGGATRLGSLPTTNAAPALSAVAEEEDDVAEIIIDEEDAERLAGLLNAANGETRKAWRARFDCAPRDLPADRLDEADDFVSDLEVAG